MRTVCIYHSIDLDGWMSAAIVKHWWLKNNDQSKLESITYLGYNYGQPIPDLSFYDKVIMCDISFPKEEMDRLRIRLTSDFIWIDHHVSAIKDNDMGLAGLRDTKFAACELTWQYFFSNETMPEIVRLLGRYDCFGHKGTDEEQKVLEFQYGARQCISNYKEAYEKLMNNIQYNRALDKENLKDERIEIWNSGISIYQYLCTEAKQVYKNGFEIELEEPDVFTFEIGSTNTVIRKFICINKERFNPINFGIDYHKDGYDGCACFHYDGKVWKFSLYNDNGEVDCSVIAKQLGGGGHKGAAGFVTNNITQFLK